MSNIEKDREGMGVNNKDEIKLPLCYPKRKEKD